MTRLIALIGCILTVNLSEMTLGFSLAGRLSQGGVTSRYSTAALRARVARKNDEATQAEDGDMMTLPVDGLVSSERGGLFDTPLSIFDPLKETDSLPGEDGSDEKIQAIQQRIQQRVAELKKSGEWGVDGDAFGRDPLAKLPLWQTMAMQVRSCKPFESLDELALTYLLMLVTTVLLSAYLLVLRDSMDTAIVWFLRNDFDNDVASSIYRSVTN